MPSDGTFVESITVHPLGTEEFFTVKQQVMQTLTIKGQEYIDCVVHVIFLHEPLSIGLVFLDEMRKQVVRCKAWDNVWEPTNIFYNHIIVRNSKDQIKVIREGEQCDEVVGIGALRMPSGAASSSSFYFPPVTSAESATEWLPPVG